MAASLTTGDQDLSGTPEDPTNLRCRKCRRCLIDSTSLLKMVTSSEAAATCNVWHLNVESLPDWILAAVYQVHWTVGKLNCQYCGARLGGFNFINGPKCTCGHDTTVHLSKSRVDQDLKPPVLLTRPGMTRGLSERRSNKTESPGHQREIKVVNCPIQTVSSVETLQRRQTQSTQLDVLPSLSSTTNTSCTFSRTVSAGDVNEPEADVESSEEPQNIGTAEMDTEVPLVSESLNPPQPSGHPENLEEGHVISVLQSRDSPHTAMDQDGVRLQVMEQPIRNPPNPETKLSKREKNHLKSLRRKQRKKERWIQSQQRAKDLAMKWDLTNSDDEDKEGYTCAVCLDVYYKPYKCHPCSHVFCEPCLRTLAKNRPSNTLCPLCRTLISHVLFQEELNQTTKKCFPKVYWSRHETFKKTNYSKWPLPNCPKRFHNFWGFQRHGRPASRWQFPHRAFGLDVLDLGDMWGWPFDIDFVIISINSLHWLLAFIIFCGLCYFFLL